ncbi:unnamed protein product [Phaeothamnion confervicola]
MRHPLLINVSAGPVCTPWSEERRENASQGCSRSRWPRLGKPFPLLLLWFTVHLCLVASSFAEPRAEIEESMGGDRLPRTTLIGSFLGTFPRMHRAVPNGWKNVYIPQPTGGDAMKMIQALVDSVRLLRASHPDTLSLVIITDVPGLKDFASDSGDFEVHVPANLSHYHEAWGFLGANDVRFVMQRDYLLELPSPCAFLIDASDVEVLRHPGALCAERPAGTLAVANDVSGAKFSDPATSPGRWMRQLVKRTHYGDGDTAFARLLADPTLPMLNCGIVGGDAGAVAEFLRRAHEALWARRSHKLTRPVDMVLANHIAHTWSGPTEFGFPEGLVSLPFRHECGDVTPRCDYGELEASGQFFFRHK